LERSKDTHVTALLSASSISKDFGSVRALEDVDLDVRRGEVHVLLGENGSGKSTLVKILSGAYRTTRGQLRFQGQPVTFASARAAREAGIATVYQELNLVPGLSVAENVFLGDQPRRAGIVDRGRLRTLTDPLLERLGADFSARDRVRDLGVAQRQLVEIAKALRGDLRLLILDEPTASLSSAEVDRLFAVVASLKADGVGMLFISHHLEEVPRVGDRVTVLRDGRRVGETTPNASRRQLVRMMVGRDIDEQFPRRRRPPGPPVLQVRGLGSRGRLFDVDVTVHEGEVVGLAGLVGSGRTELARALFGLAPIDAGGVLVDGRPARIDGPRTAKASGIGFVTEDRRGEGLVPLLSIQDNLALAAGTSRLRMGLIRRGAERRHAQETISRLAIRARGPEQPVGELSGGNQQKVVLGKWMSGRMRVLILDEPTRGVDVGAKVEIYQVINDVTDQGTGVLLISSEMPEVIGMSDRIVVLRSGRVAGELDPTASEEEILELAAP